MRALPFFAAAALTASHAAAARPEPRHHHPRHEADHHHAPPRRHAPAPRHPSHPPARHAAAAAAVPPPVAVAPPAPPAAPPVGSNTGLPLPRFASFRSEEVNMRSGPGTRYPIQWVYKRRDLPVEIEREFDVWRLVETADGTKGWVHQATLIGNRTFVTLPAATGGTTQGAGPADTAADAIATAQTVRATAAPDGAPVAYLKPGVIGHLLGCPALSDWCRVTVAGSTGFLPRRALWGLLPGEVVVTR